MMFGKPISWDAFQEQRLWLRRQLENQLVGVPESFFEPLLTQSTWDRLMLLEEAKRLRLRVDDQELAAFIQRIPTFQEQDRFLPELYYSVLRASGMTPRLFEERLRSDLLIEQLVNAVKGSVVVSDEEVNAAYTKAHEGLTASMILFETAAFAGEAAASLTDDEVRAHYEAHPDDVRLPAQIMLEYAGASREALAARVQISEEDLSAFYQDHQDQWTREDGTIKPLDEVRDALRQQLTDELVRKQLTTLALDLHDDLEAQLRFEELVMARALSLQSAGPLPVGGPSASGGPEPAVVQAVAELSEGQMSDVIETGNGVYVARATQRIPSRIPLFDEVKDKVRERLVQERAARGARSAAEAFRNRLREQRASGLRFEEVTVMEGVVPVALAPFTRTQPIDRMGYVAALNDAAFATPLGDSTEVIETPPGFVILRPEERIPADESKFAEAADALRKETLTQRQSAHVEEWLKELRARAKLQSFVE
jgi:peptidyl-prolyl cis-trans isomerase D